jgi:hypothetical protein
VWCAPPQRYPDTATEPPSSARRPGPDPRLRASRAAVRNATGDPARRCSTSAPASSTTESGSGPLAVWTRTAAPVTCPRQSISRLTASMTGTARSFRPRTAQSPLLGRRQGVQRADHLPHHRRPRRHRLVQAHPPARTRQRACLRRLRGRVGWSTRVPVATTDPQPPKEPKCLEGSA